MKKYAPRKVFILENNEYIEISYEELCYREEIDPSYKDKLFIPLHGMIMEVDETAYRDFYKAKDRDEYLTWRTKYKDISYGRLRSLVLSVHRLHLRRCSRYIFCSNLGASPASFLLVFSFRQGELLPLAVSVAVCGRMISFS